MTRSPFHCSVERDGIVATDRHSRVNAEIANDAFMDALRRYAERHDAMLLEAIRAATGRRW